MSVAGGFLGGARDRLLSASIPFRFFVAAAGFHVAAWAALLLAAGDAAGFRGGPGPMLAAIHLLTLGVLAMTAIGASYQLLPVVTRRPMGRDWPARLSFWLMLPGTLGLTLAMGLGHFGGMQAGATLVGLGLAVFAIVTADNLRRAGSVAAIAAHGWAALVALAAAATLGVLLVWNDSAGFLADHPAVALAHMTLASAGFMGMLALGLSLVLVPMFVLSRSLPQRPVWAQLALAVVAVGCFSAGALLDAAVLRWGGLVAGLAAAACHLWIMRAALRTRMRKRLGLSFLLIRAAWGLLGLGLGLAVAVEGGAAIPNGPVLAGFVLIAGWLLSLLTGVLQRIMPFLASMHAAGKSGLPALMSDLTAGVPLRLHAACHLAALALVSAGLVSDLVPLVRAGAAIGVAGAIAFAVFVARVVLALGRRKS